MAFLINKKNKFGKKGNWILVYFDADGIRKEKTSRTKNRTEAEKFKIKFLETIHSNFKGIKLTDFAEEYLEHIKPTHTLKTYKAFKSSFREFLRIAGNKNLNLYSVKDIDKFLLTKINEASKYTARKYKSHLRTAFTKALIWKYINYNVFQDCMKIQINNYKVKCFSVEEYKNLIKNVDNELFNDIINFALYTGMRLGEIIHLKKEHIDLNKRIILINSSSEHETKSKRSRKIQIAEALFNIIKKNIDRNKTYLFEGVIKRNKLDPHFVSRKFKYYIRKANLDEGYYFHCLRKTYGSWLLQSGVSIEKISKYLGHSNIRITQEYYATFINDDFNNEVDNITKFLN